ncbi:MAG: oligopeptide/dipeptide transporter, ATPase subunit [Blastococcus sp.]|nr:oligopeptide/dipeptide transporter, ATPase subunit [Blastococcus sp.]
MSDEIPLLAAVGLTVAYGRTPVVHEVDLPLYAGRRGVGLIGESGSGKTTLARALLGLLEPHHGEVTFRGRSLGELSRAERREYRSQVQPVFQDGNEALDPRMRVGASIREALAMRGLTGRSASSVVTDLLEDVGLSGSLATRRPHELSGGQRQRVVIARALAIQPRLLVLDEPTSALDVTVQARVLELLERLGEEHDLGLLLITHNLAVVERLCETAHVMFAGRVVESGPTRQLLSQPAHPYTKALRDAVPTMGGALPEVVEGATADAADTGCAYRLRCPFATKVCALQTPVLRRVGTQSAACHHAEQVVEAGNPGVLSS